MRGAASLAAWLALAACGSPQPDIPANAGVALEKAAVTAGLVVDPTSRSIAGAWALDTDRACIVPTSGGDDRIGVLIDYGQGQGCAGSGTVRRHGNDLDVRLGDCRLTARFDGTRIVFPPDVPQACDALCTGRASLAAATVERQSDAVSEAQSLRTPRGRALCGT